MGQMQCLARSGRSVEIGRKESRTTRRAQDGQVMRCRWFGTRRGGHEKLRGWWNTWGGTRLGLRCECRMLFC
jgi:hypothetical protein